MLFLRHHRLFIAGRTLGLAIDLYGLAVSSVTEVAPLCLNSSKSLTAFFKSSACVQHFILQKCCGSLSTVVARYYYVEKLGYSIIPILLLKSLANY